MRKVNGLKTLYFPEMPTSCFIDGERYDFDASIAASVQTLCNTTEQTAKELEVLMEDKVFGQLLIDWVNLGYWHFE
ncbi:winged helix domain-containing protein [Moritella sp.]|uniref:winged helix domain-containing protein n=1 Tax=Moritella sp. TaxID=78556 RepID=UPI0025D19775|nr:winged helix domain-containing protein [Moritella sp.]